MSYHFNKKECITKKGSSEWLLTNGLGGYSSSTLCFCNTRKYHGLLVANLPKIGGRHVLLSTLEESLLLSDKEYFFSSRQHPGGEFPGGSEFLENVTTGDVISSFYTIHKNIVCREVVLVQGKNLLLIKYTLEKKSSDLEEGGNCSLGVKPLLAYRGYHALTVANPSLSSSVLHFKKYISIQPYTSLPVLMMAASQENSFIADPAWCYHVEYPIEKDRGFAYQEDLFKPGQFLIPLKENIPVYLAFAVGNDDNDVTCDLHELWQSHTASLKKANAIVTSDLQEKLHKEGTRFFIHHPDRFAEILAGYHWFDAWGRDTLIALPGLSFYGGNRQAGADILLSIGDSVKNGVIPNIFTANNVDNSYNCIDSSLWYAWAVQQYLERYPDSYKEVRQHCWAVLKNIIGSYKNNLVPHVEMDSDGFLNAGSKKTQLTWMDAMANGCPVTPRNGCAVEINALWFNALGLVNHLAGVFNDPVISVSEAFLKAMQKTFFQRYFIHDEQGGYLADVWRKGERDCSFRPNQLFAVSLPYSILLPEYGELIVRRVRNSLLTPYGLRTLSPKCPGYKGSYKGSPSERDAAYHQGTVWPWLLGAYAQAALKALPDKEVTVKETLETLRPLFTNHLKEAGIGGISEIFSGDYPHTPDGCITQAWSVGEVLRMLSLFKEAAPAIYYAWEKSLNEGGAPCEF